MYRSHQSHRSPVIIGHKSVWNIRFLLINTFAVVVFQWCTLDLVNDGLFICINLRSCQLSNVSCRGGFCSWCSHWFEFDFCRADKTLKNALVLIHKGCWSLSWAFCLFKLFLTSLKLLEDWVFFEEVELFFAEGHIYSCIIDDLLFCLK